MNVSVCITTKNEERTIGDLLESLLSQSKKPDDIVIVDGGSSDMTVEVIKHYQKKDKRIRLLTEKLSRSKGRNMAVEVARYDIIAMTDAGCVAKKHWLRRITEPFKNNEVDIVAGFYDMKGKLPLQKAFSVFLGSQSEDFNSKFLPSTRSIAFRRTAWEAVGGFPESLEDTAEDTKFNFNAVRIGLKFAHAKNARVEWGMPETFKEGIKKIYMYARGDAKTRSWFHPVEGLMSHNVKAALIIVRYFAGFVLLVLSFMLPVLFVPLVLGVLIYVLFAFRKTYSRFKDIKVGLWGIALQFSSDFAVMNGFLDGIRR